MKSVLVIEDDIDICELIEIHLADLGCSITSSHDGNDGLAKALNGQFDLIVLDLMLPGLDGFSICQRLRAASCQSFILMLTARAEEFDKVFGLESGADDYLTKPFGVREFQARVKALLRRSDRFRESKEKSSIPIRMGDLSIDAGSRKVEREGRRIELTPTEFELLTMLASNPGRSFSREELLRKVWGESFAGYDHTINSHINRLRAKIEADSEHPKYILTTWGVGYRFNEEVQ